MSARPTGRSGRLLLRRRLETARKAADLLDRKQRVLRQELERLELVAEHTRLEWERDARTAALWSGRTLALCGYDAIDRGAPSSPVRVAVESGSTMGVPHPSQASCAFPPFTGSGNATLTAAAKSHRAAVESAVRHAVAARAVAALAEELARTRVRQRALEHRRIPDLVTELSRLEANLDELDREENLRMHWAVQSGLTIR